MKGIHKIESGVVDFYARRSAAGTKLLAYLGEQHDLHLLTEMKGKRRPSHLGGTRDLLAGTVSSRRYPSARWANHTPAQHPVDTREWSVRRRWHEWLPETVCKASRDFDKVIILPSSFDPRVPVVAKCLDRHNVHAFAREERSYRFIEALARASLSFDCAIYFHRFMGGRRQRAPGRGRPPVVGVAGGRGQPLPPQGLRPDPLPNRDISLSPLVSPNGSPRLRGQGEWSLTAFTSLSLLYCLADGSCTS